MADFINENDRHFISLLQENINRMAGNSANCKTWLVTLVSAITALQLAKTDLRAVLWVGLGLIVLFYLLDSYYLTIEKKFRALESDFVGKAKAKTQEEMTEGLYSFNIKSVKNKDASYRKALLSWSTLPFYLILFLSCLVICLWPCLIS